MKIKNNKKGITLLWDIHQRKASKTAALSTREVSPVHLYNIYTGTYICEHCSSTRRWVDHKKNAIKQNYLQFTRRPRQRDPSFTFFLTEISLLYFTDKDIYIYLSLLHFPVHPVKVLLVVLLNGFPLEFLSCSGQAGLWRPLLRHQGDGPGGLEPLQAVEAGVLHQLPQHGPCHVHVLQ